MDRLSLIAAVSENGVIGQDGDLPWSLPDDMKWFMQTTLGHPVITGRRNYESYGKPLRERTNIVLTRQAGCDWPGVVVAHSLDEALAIAEGSPGGDEPFIIGGQQVYELALPRVDRMYLTHVHAVVEGDTYFPPIDEDDWQITQLSHHPTDTRHEMSFTISRYDRV